MTVSDLSNSGDWMPSPHTNQNFLMTPETKTLVKKICPHSSQSQCLSLTHGNRNFLNRTEKLLDTRNTWESHVAQQIPLPRASSHTHTDKQPESMEQLEVDTGDDMDIGDFSERPANDMRPPKPPRKTKAYIMDIIPPPGCPDYMEMNHAVMGIPKPPLPEIRT